MFNQADRDQLRLIKEAVGRIEMVLINVVETLKFITEREKKIMAAIDDLQAQVAQTATDVGAHLDALDTSISTEIANAQATITAAMNASGATPAQIKVVQDALTALDTSLGTRVDATKTKVDAAFPATPPAAATATTRP